MNLESKWPMIVLEDYSNKKCLRHYMLQIVMQLTDFCSISRCHFNVFSTYLPNSLPYTMAWKPFWSRISMLIRFHKIFLCVQSSKVPVYRIEYKSKCPLGIIRYQGKIVTSYGSLCPTCFYWPSSQNRITPTYLNYVGNKLYLEVQIIMYNMVRSFNGISILSIISKSKSTKFDLKNNN